MSSQMTLGLRAHLDSMGLRKNSTSPVALLVTPGDGMRSAWKVDAPYATAAELSAGAAAAGAPAGAPTGAPTVVTMEVPGAAPGAAIGTGAGSGVPLAYIRSPRKSFSVLPRSHSTGQSAGQGAHQAAQASHDGSA